MKRSELIKKFPREIIPEKVNIELLAYRGSIVHGMYIPNSDPDSIDDIDLLGVVIPKWENYFAIEGKDQWGKRGTKEIFRGEYDCVYYEILKFINLLLKGNPNVIGILWLDDRHYITKDKLTGDLIENRNLFRSQRICESFSGYAYGQLKKMEKFSQKGYMGEKRKKLVLKHGYDTKNAAHCMRLLRMGIEFMQTGTFKIDRSGIDAHYLLSVKRGEFSLDEIKKAASAEFEKFHHEKDKCPFPKEPYTLQIKEIVWNHLKSIRRLR